MEVKKLTAGSGYDYLTRQVAAMDSTEKGHLSLASYYSAKGESPGVWVGRGMEGIEGLDAGDPVTAEQMKALFGAGYHPLAIQRQAALPPDAEAKDFANAIRLGQPYRVYSRDVSPFRMELARRVADYNTSINASPTAAVPREERGRIRTEVAREFFVAEFKREPQDARELAGLVARLSRPQTTAVAGFDLTFSPVKSVSALWALADPSIAAVIEQAHQKAMADALRYIEDHALYTRLGRNGVRQVDVQGLVGAAFTHRDSRASDPDLHTHVAVANKVQTLDGRWRSIDGRILFKATVAASETYNTALERYLATDLGLVFRARPTPEGKRPVREVAGVDPRLLDRWSARRKSIQLRASELAEDFQRVHGRTPTAVEMTNISEQAWQDTRQAKHAPRTLAAQRAAWRHQAEAVLGGAHAVDAMVASALHPSGTRAPLPNNDWYRDAARQIIATVEGERAVWQYWHVHAEAKRQLRTTGLRPDQLERAADWLTTTALERHAVAIEGRDKGIEEPDELRRADGCSVYEVAGAKLYTSRPIVDAEQRIVAAAGRSDGRRVPVEVVDVALLDSIANGLALNAGQAAMVRAMATSGARVQLGIAPAGSGKTTAMATLARAWRESGGTVVGLSPAAAAAAQLRSQIETHTDTLAKLVWSIEHHDLPGWASSIGPKTLVIIDEAGTADTLSLDTAIAFILERGGSVRLIGDDQQLGAIAAGGVLRDIAAQHGAVHLNEQLRFADPAEGSASLALREGRPESLGFYLDNGRVHIGDRDGLTRAVFDSWKADRADGKDAIMLAPTRDLVAQLNEKARAHRLDGRRPGREVALADGNHVSAGDTIITRLNDRRLRVSRTDWVKNGDRWTVLKVAANGRLTAEHNTHRRIVTLPADYVAESTELGYATTVHGAQGVTADAMHGLATGSESRQQLYTMLTRGRTANHIYLVNVGDGDPHSLVDPDTVIPPTPTDLLTRILTRDEAHVSASTSIAVQDDPAVRLGEATARYADALLVAIEHTAAPEVIARLDAIAETGLSWITFASAWPTLRTHLLLLNATGVDPLLALNEALAQGSLKDAHDAAAVLDWRLDATRRAPTGPLPWLPGIPERLAADPKWGAYLAERASLVTTLAGDVRQKAAEATRTPAWVGDGPRPPAPLLGEVAVWRAAMAVPDTDLRPTGEPQFATAAARHQRGLDKQLASDRNPALAEWTPLLATISPAIGHDPYQATLARQLARLTSVGIDAAGLLASAAAEGVLPDDHAAAALWWRINRHLEPAVATTMTDPTPTPWTDDFARAVDPDRANRLRASTWWPALVTALDHATARGWALSDLLTPVTAADVDECQALVWRTTMLTNPVHEEPVDHLWTPESEERVTAQAVVSEDEVEVVDDAWTILQIEAMVRSHRGAPELTPAEINDLLSRRDAWHEAGTTPERLAHINELAAQFYEARFPDSWAHDYLVDRLHTDLTGDPGYRPGYALDSWTSLVGHLRRQGVTDHEMILAGVAKQASTGNLIDRFRNRVVFPITHDGQILGFIARRHPDAGDTAGPKYLNTPETPLFHKGAQLYGHAQSLLRGGRPVLVEGPMDAIAVTLATSGEYVGVAALGTALTREQARQLRRYTDLPIVATDHDKAGQAAAERDYWILTEIGHDPLRASLPDGADPADLVAERRSMELVTALRDSVPLSRAMLESAITELARAANLDDAIGIIAATSPSRWSSALDSLAKATGRPRPQLESALASHLSLEPSAAGVSYGVAPRMAQQPDRLMAGPPTAGGPEPDGMPASPQR
ncbi:MAG: relaxase domain-containing protein [Propionibacteriaceae bacterium]|nr:relaxase domain-containing protein [Propionibacteriaceae bacterium]